MSEKTSSSSSGVDKLIQAQEREKLSQRCTSQKFQDSLIFFKGVEANSTIDSQYNQIATAQSSRIRRHQTGATSSSGTTIGRESIPNTRETKENTPSAINSPHENPGATRVGDKRRTPSESTNNSRPGSNNASTNNIHASVPTEKDAVQRTNSTKELHNVYEELSRLKSIVERLTTENKELLSENSYLRKENRDLKAQKSHFGTKNSPAKENKIPIIELPSPRSPRHEKSIDEAPKRDEASSHTEITSADSDDKDTTTTQESQGQTDKNLASGAKNADSSISLSSMSEIERANVTSSTTGTKGEDGSDFNPEKLAPSQKLAVSPSERHQKKERAPSSRQKHSATKSDHGHASSKQTTKLYVEKPSKNSRRSLQLEDSSIVNSMGDEDKKQVKASDGSGDLGSVRRKKERPKSQDMSELKFSSGIQLERGPCSTQDCSCSIYVHSDTETCLRCTHALTLHSLPDPDKIAKSSSRKSTEKKDENNKKILPAESKKVIIQEPIGIDANNKPKSVQILDSPKEIIKSDGGDKEESTDFHGIGDDLAAKWVIPYSELVFVEKLGKGISSVVYTGKWNGKDVAIKVLRLEAKFINDCKGELMIMSQIVSPYVVHFYGATLDTKLAVVMEICANGSLFHCLQNTAIPIFWKRVLEWSIQIVHGMNILHEWNPVILHRDMKSLNLLVDVDWNLKLCDFGLSRFNTEASQAQTLAKLRGTYTYTAPEMYFKNKYTTKSDVFSMGVIFWELVARLMSGKYIRPYSEYKDINMDYQIIYRVATKGLRPTMPVGCPESYAALIMRCLDNSPEIRPSCKDLIEIINGLKKEFKKKKQKWKKTEFVEKKRNEKMRRVKIFERRAS
jgi:regulator of replication initiation timing